MLQLTNSSPFKAALGIFPNVHGVDSIYAVVTATFALWPRLALSEQQVGPALSDDYHGEPGSSSLRYAGELHLGKPTTDVILVGHARSPDNRSVTELDVGLRLAERQKIARVFGDREWLGWQASRPAPFVAMPLVYERAFGGVVRLKDAPPLVEERNPVGVGLLVACQRGLRGDAMPNIEDPRQLLSEGSRSTPTGFGCVAPSWLPRRGFAGTYDEHWQRTRAPFLPADFQPRYFNCAAEGLVFDRYLQGGELLVIMGVSERGPLTTALPTCQLRTVFVLRGQRHERPNHLQTVLIEPDENRLRLNFHAEFPCDKAVLEVECVEIALDDLTLATRARP